MSEVARGLLALVGGGLAGVFFFGGLWWTLRVGADPRRSALIWPVSLVCRVALVVGAFWLLAGNHWGRLLLCLVGFVVARSIVVRRVTGQPGTRPRKAGTCA